MANLGGDRNKRLNERISNRQKDHYINEQANKYEFEKWKGHVGIDYT